MKKILLIISFIFTQELDWYQQSVCDIDYMCTTYSGYSLAETLLGALAKIPSDNNNILLDRVITKEDKYNSKYEDTFKLYEENILDLKIGNIHIQNLTSRIITESGLGEDSDYTDEYKNISELTVSIDRELDQLIIIQRNIEESGLGEDSEYNDNIVINLLNCTIVDLINELTLNDIIIKWDVIDFKYYILLSIPLTSFD